LPPLGGASGNLSPGVTHRRLAKSDNLKNRGPRDDARIKVNEEWELNYWTDKFGVSPDDLKEGCARSAIVKTWSGRSARALAIAEFCVFFTRAIVFHSICGYSCGHLCWRHSISLYSAVIGVSLHKF
jgi:hypothetical protein